MPDSRFYGAALAALAVGNSSTAKTNRAAISGLTSYLQREQNAQPLHHRVVLLWTSAKLREALPDTARKALIEEIWQKQQADGTWTVASLGPWKERADAPAEISGSSYATGLVAFALQEAGVSRSDVRLKRALDWLRAHQDRVSGAWTAQSMNKHYEPGSMQIGFMNDAATAFASMALLEKASR
jgi:hypothetical protein